MNKADEALSRMALASTDEPSGALTMMRQVMSSKFDFNPTLQPQSHRHATYPSGSTCESGLSVPSPCYLS